MRYGAISLADSGAITFQTNGSITAQGTSGTLTLTSGSGGTASAGDQICASDALTQPTTQSLKRGRYAIRCN